MVDPIVSLLNIDNSLTIYAVLVRLALALAIGALVGCERAQKRHSAGLRTFLLVTFSGTIAMIIDLFLMEKTLTNLPILSAVAVISSALLSGNSILYSSRSQIKGLTTSAGLWVCSLLGVLCGSGLYTITIICTIILYVILAAIPSAEKFLKDRSNHFELHLELKNKSNLQDFVATIRSLGLRIDDIESNPAYIGSGLSVYTVTVTIKSKELKKYKTHEEIIEALKTLEYINHIEEMT
ncbi:MAG: MgtC/SapB family protein [Clostridiales bacterium]|nr:MgtC/SapB family protein [Clostridiales bacterium]